LLGDDGRDREAGVRSNVARSCRGTSGFFSLALAALVALLPGCVGDFSDTPEGDWWLEEGDGGGEPEIEPPPELDDDEIAVEEEAIDESAFEVSTNPGYQATPGTTVGDIVTARGCSSAPTMPLNNQIAEQMNCIEDGFFERIDDIPNVALGAAAAPFMQAPAAAALRLAAAAKPSQTLSITNSWRSVAQQYVLYSWQGSCGISIAARPGGSNHESGLAIDVPLDTTTTFRSSLRSNGFRWYCDARNGGSSSGCGDRPHHDYTGGGVDLRSRSVLAFQQLWNHDNPDDRIAEDGVYGPATASRIRQAPVGGFAAGTTCAEEPEETCGNGTCAGGEECASCPDDCGACPPTCGDGRCEGAETCGACPGDCGACPPTCGDGTCDPGESCETCAGDCGACSTTCDVEGHGGTGENGDPCTEEPETWRCVTSEHWGDTISQVCRDGEWVTYQLGPRDCDACCGDYSIACRP
jgi:hypothetical protein